MGIELLTERYKSQIAGLLSCYDRIIIQGTVPVLHLHPKTHGRLVRLSKEAERDGACRVAKCLRAIVLNSEGRTSGELAGILKAPRSRVSEWLSLYQTHGVDGLLEGYRSGRPPLLTTEGWALIFTGEASFRQDSTLHATWSRVGHPPEVPVTGERKSVKILGAIELWNTRFHYRQDTVFNATTCHKDADVWRWFAANRRWLEVHQLPPYSPELNPTGRLWQHTRKNGTRNRHFAIEAELVGTLSRVFAEIQSHPELIRSYLLPFG